MFFLGLSPNLPQNRRFRKFLDYYFLVNLVEKIRNFLYYLKNVWRRIFHHRFSYIFFLDCELLHLQNHIITQRARKFKKVQAKKFVKSNKSKKILHMWNCFFGSFKLFPSSKIDFCSFLKLQKNENWFSWFHELFGLDFF